MASKKGYPVHGWLVIDKPAGMSSTAAVGLAKRLYAARKAGHAGTLDPLATGLLPIAFGEATKTVPFAVDGMKSYRFTVRWGAETDTDDTEGSVTETSAQRPTTETIEAALPAFTGEIEQVPPRYSAIKVDGERAYDRAREGEEFDLQARTVNVSRLELSNCPSPLEAVFEADCGKGTYVRAIARDLGRRLGCYGHIAALRRTRVGPFREKGAISVETLVELGNSAAGRGGLLALLQPVETALDDIPALSVSSADALRLRRGQSVLLRGAGAPILRGPVYAMSRGVLVAVGDARQGEFHPMRVFNFSE